MVARELDDRHVEVEEQRALRNVANQALHPKERELTIPEYNGRDIVGWVGVAMLIMSLTGLYLWWPRGKGFVRGLRWRRGPAFSFNLHHMLGFWIAIPLAIVALTGIYLGFPQQGRAWLPSVAPMTPQQRGGINAPLMRETNLNIDAALASALGNEPDARGRDFCAHAADPGVARAVAHREFRMSYSGDGR